MNSPLRISPRVFFVLSFIVVALLILPVATRFAAAQKRSAVEKPAKSHANAEAPGRSATPAVAENDYGKKIKEYTTEKFFLTELVDHLPMSDTVPSPDKVLGYIVGTPNKLTYS